MTVGKTLCKNSDSEFPDIKSDMRIFRYGIMLY